MTKAIQNLSVAEQLYRRNKELNDELEQQKIDSDIRIAEITEKYNEVKRLHAATRSELERKNPVHPFLDTSLIADPNYNQDALRWRISAPKFDWNDKTDSDLVRIHVINGEPGLAETVGVCFSNAAFLLHQSYIMDMVIKDVTERVSNELATYLENKITQGIDNE